MGATKIQFRRGTDVQRVSITPDPSEPIWTTDSGHLFVGDGSTVGGVRIGGKNIGVDTLNSLYEDVTLSGQGTVNITEDGQVILISGMSSEDYLSSLNSLTGAVTISGAGIVEVSEDGQIVVVSGEDLADVDDINSLTGSVTVSGAGNVNVSEDGQNIIVSGEKYTDSEARTASVEDDAYGDGWNGDTNHAPSQNAIYDELESRRDAEILFIIDGGGETISTGEYGYVELPFDCNVDRVTLLAQQSGSIAVDIWVDSYDNFPPDDADSICGGNEPSISSGLKYQDTILSGWTTSLYAEDLISYNVDSCSGIERVSITLKVTK